MSEPRINVSRPGINFGASQLFNQGAQNLAGAFSDYGDRIRKRAISARVNQLLSMKPQDGEVMGGGFTPVEPVDGQVVTDYSTLPTLNTAPESAQDFEVRQRKALSGVPGIDPLMALGLAQKTAEPYYKQETAEREQSNADRLFGLNQNKFDETVRHNTTNEAVTALNNENTREYRANTIREKVNDRIDTARRDTVTHPKTGKTYGWNPRTNKYDIPIFKDYGTYGTGYLNGDTVQVTNQDGYGTKTTRTVPKYAETPDGRVIINPESTGVVAPTLSQKDKDFVKTYGQGSDVVKAVSNTFDDTGLWGGLDAITGPIGSFLNTDEGKRQALLKQDLSNLRLEASKKLAGVLSDKDMQTILDTIPQVSDQPDLAKAKLQKVYKAMSDADAKTFNRLAQSNPIAVKDLIVGMTNKSIPVPAGYKLVQYDNGAVALVKK